MLLFIIACVLAMFVLLAVGYHQTQKTPQLDLREKLKNLAKDPEGMAREIELGTEKKRIFDAIDFRSIFTKFTGQSYMDALEKELTQCDIPLKPGEFLALRVGFVALAFVLMILMTRNVYTALLVAGIAAILHIPVLKVKRSMRVNKFTNSLRSGQTFLQGVDIASRESPNPIGMEFRLMLKETNLGIPVETSFNNMLVRVPSEDLKIVMSAFSIQRNVGGNLADIMDQVAAMIRQRIQIQGQIKVLTTQGKLSGAIVGLLPFGLAAVISLINYDYMKKLWTPMPGKDLAPEIRFMGPELLAFGIFMQLLGCFTIWKICDIEV
jgi:tight adherence protein B